MEVIKKIKLNFTEEEKDVINDMLKLVQEFSESEACDALDGCAPCPFKCLCDFRNQDANYIEHCLNSSFSS